MNWSAFIHPKRSRWAAVISLVLIIANLFCVSSFAAAPEAVNLNAQSTEPVFADVDPASRGYAYIREMYSRGIVSGDVAGGFHPNSTVTAGEFYAWLFRLAGYECDPVTTGHWASNYAKIASKVMVGTSYGIKYDAEALNQPITRMHAVELTMRAFGYENPTSVKYLENPFPDITVEPNTFKAGMAYLLNAYHLGLIRGQDDGCMYPYENVTRAEACEMLLTFQAADLNKPAAKVLPEKMRSLDVEFVGDCAYSFMNDLGSVLESVPSHLIERFIRDNGRIIITNKDYDYYFTEKDTEISGCYYIREHEIYLFNKNREASFFFSIGTTFVHEFGHYIYHSVLTPEQQSQLRESYYSDELDAFAKVAASDYCKTNVDEYFAELFANSMFEYKYSRIQSAGCTKALAVLNSVVSAEPLKNITSGKISADLTNLSRDNSRISGAITVENPSEKEETVTLAVACYADGRMTDIRFLPAVSVDAGSSWSDSVTFDAAGKVTVKLFLLSADGAYIPMQESVVASMQ